MMKNSRYGKFRISDYCTSWVGMVVLVALSIASIILDLSPIFIVFPIVYAAVWLLSILMPQREKFVIDHDTINVFTGKSTYTIAMPSELVLVISRADIAPLFAVRTATRGQTHILKGKYAVSILRGMPLAIALEALHRNHLQAYTTSTIQNAFGGFHYIYSFVCNQTLLDQIMRDRKCVLVIPESLLAEILVDLSAANVYIDKGC